MNVEDLVNNNLSSYLSRSPALRAIFLDESDPDQSGDSVSKVDENNNVIEMKDLNNNFAADLHVDKEYRTEIELSSKCNKSESKLERDFSQIIDAKIYGHDDRIEVPAVFNQNSAICRKRFAATASEQSNLSCIGDASVIEELKNEFKNKAHELESNSTLVGSVVSSKETIPEVLEVIEKCIKLDHCYTKPEFGFALGSLPTVGKEEIIEIFLKDVPRINSVERDYLSMLQEPKLLPLCLNLDEKMRIAKLKYQIGDVVFVKFKATISNVVECLIEDVAPHLRACYLISVLNSDSDKQWIPESAAVKKKKKSPPRMITVPGSFVSDVSVQVELILTKDFHVLHYHKRAEEFDEENLIDNDRQIEAESCGGFGNLPKISSPSKARPNRVPYGWKRENISLKEAETETEDISLLLMLKYQEDIFGLNYVQKWTINGMELDVNEL